MPNETEDFEQTYEALEKENFPDGKRIKFIAELGVSSDIEGHFRLICRTWKEEKNLRLESSFDRHGEEGLRFLLERLKKTEISDALLQRQEASEELSASALEEEDEMQIEKARRSALRFLAK